MSMDAKKGAKIMQMFVIDGSPLAVQRNKKRESGSNIIQSPILVCLMGHKPFFMTG